MMMKYESCTRLPKLDGNVSLHVYTVLQLNDIESELQNEYLKGKHTLIKLRH